ncbi:MAG: hypothetical protein ACRC92_06295 [Peptostreptococcaceae bacterium]
MKFIHKILIMTLLLCSGIKAYAVNMRPITFDKRIDNEDGYSEIIFENTNNKPIRYKISISSPSNGEKDMSEWVTVSPKILTIPAYDKRPLKIFAKSPAKTAPGEYAFTLKVDTVIIPTISKTEDNTVKGNATVAFTPIVTMRGYVGNPKFNENFNLENLKLDKDKGVLTAKIVNNSYIGKELAMSYVGSNEFILGGARIGRVSAGLNKDITLELGKSIRDNIKEIKIYDIKELEEIKRIALP